MDKTLLILGGGIDQTPGILKAKEMGLYTVVLDGNPNAAGKEYADEFYVVSVKHFEQIEKFINTSLKKKFDGVIAFGVDIASIVAKTADLLGVNYTISLNSANISEDKFIAKEFMRKSGISIPEYRLVNDIYDIKRFIEKYDFPIVIKPVDNSAARGINYINDWDSIENAYNHALRFSKKKKIEAEKFLEGPQISTESFVVNGKIYNIGFSDRNYKDIDRFLPNIIENGGDMPSIYMKEKHKEQLTQYLGLIAKRLNIKNGVIKGDLVIYNDNAYIIEFALRLSGGNFSTIEIPENTGIDFLKIAIKLHMNMEIYEYELKQIKDDFISLRYKFAEDYSSGIIKKIIMPPKKDIILSRLHIMEGDFIPKKTTDHAKRVGFAIARGNSRKEAIQNAQEYLNNIRIVVE